MKNLHTHLPTATTRLLISVTSVQESRSALRGGADLLDLKNPASGSLGAVSPVVATGILREDLPVPVSLACGEVASRFPDEWRSVSAMPRVRYCKLGLAGLACRGDWIELWRRRREAWSACFAERPEWVAVIYADSARAEAPRADGVIKAAAETGCAGVLWDTCLKDGRGLLDWTSLADLTEGVKQCHRAGLFAALAGSLRVEQLPQLKATGADIIAVRGAATGLGDRLGMVDAASVAALRRSLDSA